MLKGTFAVLSLAGVALLCLHAAGAETANSSGVDACESSATGPAGVIFACPQGDGDALNARGLTISVTALNYMGVPCVGVPATDIWLKGCFDLLACSSSLSRVGAAAATDGNGRTTITGHLAAGGCDHGGVRVVVQGVVIGVCTQPCVPVVVRSADFNANGVATDITDFAFFTTAYPVIPAVNDCRDLNNDNKVDIADYAKYTLHYQHAF